MRPIFICDDNESQLFDISTLINHCILFHDDCFSYCMHSTHADDILSYIQDHNIQGGVYFLDIELSLEDMDGIRLAIKIRKLDFEAKIIFITSHSQYAPLTLKKMVEPLAFIEKKGIDHVRNEIIHVLNLINEQTISRDRQQHSNFSFKIENIIYNFSMSHIIYLQTSPKPHRLILTTSQDNYQFYGKIKDYKEKFEGQLLEVARGTLVNPNQIRKADMKKRLIYFDQAEPLIFSRGKKDLIEQILRR